uniref:Uncharacterized protein n=1 Tax=Ciona savignyi TaxID=51511 RepID=H2YZ36_CIOSA
MSKNTVEGRCQEFPDEFIQKGNALICKWCNKQLHCLRKDNLVEHLYSNMHQENRTAKGAKMFYDPENSPKYLQRRLLQRKTLSKKKRETRPPAALSPRNTQVEDEESLDKIFSNSDSDDTESFQGFDETALKSSPTIEAPQREGRQRKRPSHLSDSILPKNLSNINQTEEPVTSQTTPLPKKRRKSSFSAVSPTAKKSAVTKKSRKSDIRSPIRPNKKGTLKIKIRRKTDTKSKSFEVDTSESEADDEEN